MAHKGRACKVFLIGTPTTQEGSTFLPVSSFLLSFGGGADPGEELDLIEDHKPLFELPETPSICGKLTRMENTAAVQP